MDVLVNHLGVDEIRARVRKPLSGLRVACYYGCLLTRPPEIAAYDDPEHPTCMDDLLAAAGAEPVEWPYKTECCGASLSMTNSSVAARLGHKLLSMARTAGAECVAVSCPLCQINLDLRQADARKAHGEIPETPALYVTQLLGLALGLSPQELGLDALIVSPESLLKKQAGSLRHNWGHTREMPGQERNSSCGAGFQPASQLRAKEAKFEAAAAAAGGAS